MKAFFPIHLLLAGQAAWSAITLTLQDPKQQPITGVSCAQAGGAKAVSDAQGKVVVAVGTSIKPVHRGSHQAPLFNIPVDAGGKASLALFDSRGRKVAAREIGAGDALDFDAANRGVYHLRISGSNLSVSQTVVNMGQGFRFTGFIPGSFSAAGAQAKASATAAVEVTCQKAGYATKVYSLPDGSDKTIGFGMRIGRAFDRDAYPKYPGFNLEVVEDFNTADWPDGLTWDANYASNDAVWEPSDAGFNDNQVRFNPEQVKFKDDALVLVMEQKDQPESYSHSESDNCYTEANPCRHMAKARTIASGEIRSKNTDFRYGRYEVTIDPPDKGSAPGNGAGFLAAMFTWHTPRDVNWREIDIEVMGNNDAGFLTNLFFANNQPQYSPNIEKPNPNTKPAAAFNSKAANKYAFEWLPGKVNWYVNDALVRTLSENPADGAANYLGSLKVSKLGSKVVMNFWSLNNASVGGLMSTNQYPMEAKFDNFRYYRWDEDGDKVKYPETP